MNNKQKPKQLITKIRAIKGVFSVVLGASWYLSVGQWLNYYPIGNGYSIGWTLLYLTVGAILWML